MQRTGGAGSSDNCFHLRVQGRAGKGTQNSFAEKKKKVEQIVSVSWKEELQ